MDGREWELADLFAGEASLSPTVLALLRMEYRVGIGEHCVGAAKDFPSSCLLIRGRAMEYKNQTSTSCLYAL